MAACPEVFTLTDWGYAEAVDDDLPAGLEAPVTEAIEACPEHAITRT